MICKRCNTIMRYVMRFEKDKFSYFYRCPKCYTESKKFPLTFTSADNKKRNPKRKEKQDVLCVHNNDKRYKKT